MTANDRPGVPPHPKPAPPRKGVPPSVPPKEPRPSPPPPQPVPPVPPQPKLSMSAPAPAKMGTVDSSGLRRVRPQPARNLRLESLRPANLRLALSLLAALGAQNVFASLGHASPQATPETESDSKATQVADHEPVESQSKKKPVPLGQIIRNGEDSSPFRWDAIVDLETAQVAAFVERKEGKAGQHWRAAPFSTKNLSGDSDFEFQPATFPDRLTRKFVAGLYTRNEIPPYWTEYLKDLASDVRKLFDPDDVELSLYSKLVGKEVLSKNGKSIGQIADLAIRPDSRRIEYVLLRSETSDQDALYRAIPLSAFVASEVDEKWIIQLPRMRVLRFQPFSLEQLPSNVDRGWEEYVSVRYGRPGIQEASSEEGDRADL